MTDANTQVVLAVVGPTLTALLAGASVVAKDWRLRRDHQSRQTRLFKLAAQQVAFIDAWLTTYMKTAGADTNSVEQAAAVRDLNEAYEMMRTAATMEPDRVPVHRAGHVVRTLLLIPLSRPGARVVRIFYYVSIPLATAVFAVSVDSTFGLESVSVTVALVVVFFFTAIAFTPSALLWALARRMERSRPGGSDGVTATSSGVAR